MCRSLSQSALEKLARIPAFPPPSHPCAPVRPDPPELGIIMEKTVATHLHKIYNFSNFKTTGPIKFTLKLKYLSLAILFNLIIKM